MKVFETALKTRAGKPLHRYHIRNPAVLQLTQSRFFTVLFQSRELRGGQSYPAGIGVWRSLDLPSPYLKILVSNIPVYQRKMC